MGPRILLLGAGGFIGRSVCREFLDSGCQGELVLHFRRRDRRDPVWLEMDRRYLDLRLADLAVLAQLVDSVGPDVIVNCVGLTTGTAADLHAVNVDIVTKLIATVAGRPDVHLVHIGSAAEYGVQREGMAVAETALAAPRSIYGLAKHEATRRLMDSVAAGRVNATILRVFNPLGRYSSTATLAGSAAKLIDTAIRQGHRAVHLGNLDTWRDYVDTRDVAAAVLAAAGDRRQGGVVLNVGRGEAVLSRSLIATLAEVSGYDGSIVESEPGSQRSHVVRWQCADTTAIRDQLGWTPRFTVTDSLRDLWEETQNPLSVVCR